MRKCYLSQEWKLRSSRGTLFHAKYLETIFLNEHGWFVGREIKANFLREKPVPMGEVPSVDVFLSPHLRWFPRKLRESCREEFSRKLQKIPNY